jgi:flagellar motor component MotA
MKSRIFVALPLFLFINYMAVSDSLAMFVDTASVLIVMGGAIPFALCGTGGWLSASRLNNAAEGAVIAGWLGALYGSVMILSGIDERALDEWIGPATAVMVLTVIYGYFFRAICRLVILARDPE